MFKKFMSKYKKHVVVLAVVILAAAIVHLSCDEYVVYYIPLSVDFVAPPTPQDLEEHGTKITMRSCSLSMLFKACESADDVKNDYNEFKMIRVKIIRQGDGKSIYITQNMKVLSEERQVYNISASYTIIALLRILLTRETIMAAIAEIRG